MSLPYGNTGSLCSSFLPDRPVCLPVKRPSAITLSGRLPIVLRAPLEASVTLLEATTPVKLPTKQCPSIRKLELKQTKGRISTAAPQTLACLLQSLRPILHIACPNSMLSYSKGSRGLFVPSRVIGIFTDTTISLSSRLRQRPDHYTIRAGRNLPDKEFRLSSYQPTPWVGGGWCVLACTRTFPACRHADRTISSSAVADVRRMVSEGSRRLPC